METLKKSISSSLSRRKCSVVYSFPSLKVQVLYENIPNDNFLQLTPNCVTDYYA